MFYLQKVFQGHGVQLFERRRSLANVKSTNDFNSILRQLSPFQGYSHLKSWTEAREKRDIAAAESLLVD